jgi:two-component system phosphate regulon sensor histidine kinase PhoR
LVLRAIAQANRELAGGRCDAMTIQELEIIELYADRAVEAIVSSLPDPTIALTPDTLVVAFNASAQHISPGILRGEPISFALRVPNVLEAIRAVAASRHMRRTEFFQRCRPIAAGSPSRRCCCPARRRTRPAISSS